MDCSSVKLSKYFPGEFVPIDSLSFSDEGSYLISSTGDTLTSYVIRSASKHNVLTDKPTGFRLVKYTHNEDEVLSANKFGKEPSVTLSNLYSSQEFKRIYPHSKLITSIDVNSSQNIFLTSGLDCILKLWDLREFSNVSAGYMTGNDYNVCKFDPSGVVIGVSENRKSKGYIKLYDTRKLEDCHFYEQLVCENGIKDFQFSNDGGKMAVTTCDHQIIQIDALNLDVVSSVKQYASSVCACFSVDSKHISAGVGKDIEIFNDTASVTLKGNISEIKCMEWNPSYYLLAAGCKVLCLYTL